MLNLCDWQFSRDLAPCRTQPILDIGGITWIQPTKTTDGVELCTQLTDITVNCPEGQMSGTTTIVQARGAHVLALGLMDLSATTFIARVEEPKHVTGRRLRERRRSRERRRQRGMLGHKSLEIRT